MPWSEVDRLSDALALGLQRSGIAAGERVLVCLQNVPQFVIAMIGIWKAGAILVPTNPMYRSAELRHTLVDSGAIAVIASAEEFDQAMRAALIGTAVRLVLTTRVRDFLDGQQVPPHLKALLDTPVPVHTTDLLAFCRQHADTQPAQTAFAASDIAMIAYTSGTTGPQKGATNTHANVNFASQVYRDFIHLQPDEPVLGVAPLSHMTGLIAHMGISVITGAPLVLMVRFDAGLCLRLLQQYRCGFMVGSITVFVALTEHPDLATSDLSALTRAYSGGAPVAPSLVERFEQLTGCYIHNCFGMTETTAPAVLTPRDARAPVDPASGALSIGVPVPDTIVTVHDDQGQPLVAGEVGELYFSGPQVVPGYWNNPQATRNAITPDGALRSGDIGFMDAAGWVYLIDRKKDQINAAGFKVWPREVEDVLYQFPGVNEVIVVGVPDAYRGETVAAFIRLADQRPQAAPTVAAVQAFCRERLAAFKCPTQVSFVSELPKTATGKLSRQAVRSQQGATEG
ncbi:MAG: AMP-binding protein [Rhodoferax sp.]|nr:AMP-binding protein [Rhodoferax sp.]